MTVTKDNSLQEYLDAIGAKKSTPGGGYVAAINCAEGIALMLMVANFSRDLAADELISLLKNDIEQCLALASADSDAFDAVMMAWRNKGDMRAVSIAAAAVPIKIIGICRDRVKDLDLLVREGNPNLISDVGISANLLDGSLASCELNVLINAQNLDEKNKRKLLEQIDDIATLRDECQKVYAIIKSKLQG